MDGFSYVNIFATKGIEYLIIISFLILIVPFWRMINRQKSKNLQKNNVNPVFREDILRIPQGLFYAPNHTWAFLEKKGNVRVGIDDFFLHVTGARNITMLKTSGDSIKKGELVAEASLNGNSMKIKSPVTGIIVSANSTNGTINDPYGKSWIYTIKPEDWKTETSSFYFAGEAVGWMKNEFARFREFMAENSNRYLADNKYPVMQDGGEMRDNPLAELPQEAWQNFEKSFLI